jgi:hypothetical protein
MFSLAANSMVVSVGRLCPLAPASPHKKSLKNVKDQQKSEDKKDFSGRDRIVKIEE